jgi:hypothetical protein
MLSKAKHLFSNGYEKADSSAAPHNDILTQPLNGKDADAFAISTVCGITEPTSKG